MVLKFILGLMLLYALPAYSDIQSAVEHCPTPTKAGMSAGVPSGCFDYYVFAQTWMPQFCQTGNRQRLKDCQNLNSHSQLLQVHGLWPNFKAYDNQTAYPAYCKESPGCDTLTACALRYGALNDKLTTQLALYITVNRIWLMNHEWKKHGSCSDLTPDAYFKAITKVAKSLPTPKLLKENLGSTVTYSDLVNAFGGQKYVNILCQRSRSGKRQYLSGIRTFWSKQLKRMANPGKINHSCDALKPIYLRDL